MDRWKATAILAMGFACGVAYTAACGGGAKDSAASATDGGAGRAVVYVAYTLDLANCSASASPAGCCPSGFTAAGFYAPAGSYILNMSVACVED
jgi:hypothetical protein